jgi:hypothetical protein
MWYQNLIVKVAILLNIFATLKVSKFGGLILNHRKKADLEPAY